MVEGCFLFDGLQKEEILQIEKTLSSPVSYKKGEIIYRGENFSPALGFVLKGKAFALSADSLHMNSFTKGSCFGAAALFGGEKTYVSTIVAEQDTDLLFITEEQLKYIFAVFPKCSLNYISFLSDKVRFLNKKIGLVSTHGSEETLYKYLTSVTDSEGYALLPKSMTLLSKMLGIGRATLYRAIDSLEKSGRILRENNKVKVIKNEKNS